MLFVSRRMPSSVNDQTLSVVFQVSPLAVAVRVTSRFAATGCVVTGNEAVVLPASTVTLGGTTATEGSELAGVTSVPPAGAREASVTRPVEGSLPTTGAGL